MTTRLIDPKTGQPAKLTPKTFEDRLSALLVEAVNEQLMSVAMIIGVLEAHKLRLFKAISEQQNK